MKTLFFVALLDCTCAWAQNALIDTLSTKPIALTEVQVEAVRATRKTPIAFSELSKKQLLPINLGQDVPILLSGMVGVVITSDAGNGIGYSGLRVRGSDATRINVTINGVPYNDAESHGTFWVNIPDIASSVETIQLQRGVGTSTNGAAAFGASLNMNTQGLSAQAQGELSASVGSYNTQKQTVKFSTGILNEAFELSGRLSHISSDGYIDRASSNLKSYFLQGTYLTGGSLIKAIIFGGREKTYQAWNGVTQADIAQYGRRYNPAGRYINEEGKEAFYNNQTDNYQQHHKQLHWYKSWEGGFSSHLGLHYTAGEGYYENYRENRKISSYKLKPWKEDVEKTNVIEQKHLDNQFYGVVYALSYKSEAFEVTFGGGINTYLGWHFGKVLWAKMAQFTHGQEYYRNQSHKGEVNNYLKLHYNLTKNWGVYADMQLRSLRYTTTSEKKLQELRTSFTFFNPKAGLVYQIDKAHSFYGSYAKAQREPNRDDYQNGNPEHEVLHNFEMGYKFRNNKIQFGIGSYYMHYKNQLVLTGALDDVGAPIRANSGKSYRMGVEVESQAIWRKWQWQLSMALSDNRNLEFIDHYNGLPRELGNTPISFSPQLVVYNALIYNVLDGFNISLNTKYVSEQYLSNNASKQAILSAYWLHNAQASYTIKMKKWAKSLALNLQVNNLLGTAYASNGYYYTYEIEENSEVKTVEQIGYYPQALTNFILGIRLSF